MLKVYGIHGRTQAVIKVPVNGGKAWLECEFKHGRIGAGLGNRPATYPTSDPVEQSIIENSKFFGPMITIVRVAGTEADNKKPAAAPAPEKSLEAVTSVTSREEAVAYLKAKGAKATDLKSDAAIKKSMEKIGVFFPNYEF